MTQKLDKHVLKNGMIILGEPMGHVSSAAFTFLVPAGAAMLDDGCCGASSVMQDWLFRGAGAMDSRKLVDALEAIGLHRDTSVSSSHISLTGALEAGNLLEAIRLYSEVILAPALDEDQFELARQLAIDDVHSLDDDPRHKVMLNLYEQFYPEPFGRSAFGKVDQLETLNVEKARELVKKNFNISEMILAVAGKYDFEAVCKQIERAFDKPQSGFEYPHTSKGCSSKYTHLQQDTAQVHIGVMTETVTVDNPDYYNAKAAVSVLSGGMSSRLFTEVREKRGLCYAIGAQYHALKQFAGIGCYAGTTPDKAQETLDVIIAEFNRLADGVNKDEVERAKVGLKSSLIMLSESTSSRAGSAAGDQYILGKVRVIDEIKEAIEKISADSIQSYLNRNKFNGYSVVTIGPKKIKY